MRAAVERIRAIARVRRASSCALGLVLLVACHHAPPFSTAAVNGCRSPRATDGFSPIAASGATQFVAAAEDEPLATDVFTSLAQSMPGLERRVPGQEDRHDNLIVFGRFETNSLIRSLDRTGALEIDRGSFHFGGHVYDDSNDGIAVVFPSPFAADRFVLAYVGNSPAGLLLTQSVPTGAHQFTVVAQPVGVAQEGDFCQDGPWHYFAPYAVDSRSAWEAYRATLAHHDSPHHVIYYEPGSAAARDIDAIAGRLELDYADILNQLEVSSLDHPIVTYLWSDRAKKKRFTGDGGNGQAIGNVIHAMYTDDVNALGPHEYVHVVAGARIGEGTALWSEGLAVALGHNWQGEALPAAATRIAAAGKLPSFEKLTCCFRDVDDNLSYPIAGSFVAFVIERYGIAKLKQIYARSSDKAAIHEVLGVDPGELEAQWLASVKRGR